MDPGSADVAALVAGTEARVLTSSAWIDEVDARTRSANEIGLWVLLGPAGLYAGIAIVNSVLIGAQRGRERLAHRPAMHRVFHRELADRQPLVPTIAPDLLEQLHS